MASPNVKVDKSVKIRRRNTLPGPLYKIRHQSAMLQKRHTSGGLPSSSMISGRGPSASSGDSSNHHTRWHHLHQSKTNPYVGWFRHAPSLTTVSSTVSLPKILSSGMKSVNVDTLWLRDWLVDSPVFHQHKKRRIIMKDHAFTQFKYQQDQVNSTLVQLKQVIEHRTESTKRDLNLDLLLLYKRRGGHLRGGGPDKDPNSNELDDTKIEQYLQRQYASSTESITIKALSRIACWLLDIPVPSTTTASNVSLKENHPDGIEEVNSILSYDDDDESRSVCSYDNHDTISGSRFRTSVSDFSVDHGIQQHEEERYPVGHGLSSQAEAYYALGAVYRHILAENTPHMSGSEMTRHRSDSLDDVDRLDYEITQMDIVRMNRIASRHLDVESIVRLPVFTYPQKKSKATTNNIPTIPEDRVPIIAASRSVSCDVDNITSRDDGEEEEVKHDAEFSWMLIPPSYDDDSINSSSTMERNAGGYYSEQTGRPQEDEVNDTRDDVCVICLESFIPGDRLRVLPCTHSFHVGCIDRWLSGSHSFYDCYTAGCPTCKIRPDTTTMVLPGSDPASSHKAPQSVPLSLQLHESDGSVPSWAMARIGHILAHESQHF